MSVVNTGTVLTSGAGPHTVSITLDSSSGSDRAVVVVAIINDTNPAANTCTFDPAGINTAMTELFDVVTLSTNSNIHISAWYILDTDLPSGTGAFNVDVTHTLSLTGIALVAYYLEDVTQSAPSSSTGEDNATSTPSISTSAGSTDTIMDVWNSTDNFGTYTPDSGQTEIFDQKVGNQLGFSSHRTGSTAMGWTNDGAESRDHVGGYIFFTAASAGGTILPFITKYYRGLN